MTTTKQCRVCDEVKDITEYYRNKRSKDGYDTRCKECTKVYNQAHTASRNKATKAWQDRNPGVRKAYQAEWYKRNKARIAAKKRKK